MVKICADGSERTTQIAYANDMGSGSITDIALRVKEDPTGTAPEYFGSFSVMSSESDSIVFAYQHPRLLDSSDPCKLIHLQVINTAGSDSLVLEYPMYLYRAPVVMMHGLWSDRNVFATLNSALMSYGLWPSVLTLRCNYPSDRSFQENKAAALSAVKTAILMARNNNFSSGRVNVVAHSMGGDIARLFIQDDDQYDDDICRLITLNTPHSGSQLANWLYEHPIPYGTILSWFGKNPFGGAVEDLRVDSDAIVNRLNGETLNGSIVPSRTIVTQTTLSQASGWVGGILHFLSLDNPIEDIDTILADLYNGEENDIVVPVSSQGGGAAPSTTFPDQSHFSTNDGEIIDEVIVLLNQDPLDSEVFNQSGFNPPVLNYDYGLRRGNALGSVEITESFDRNDGARWHRSADQCRRLG